MDLCSSSPLSLDSSVFFSETSSSCVFVINVGGSRFVLSQDVLASYPDTRLGKLASCGPDSALELCDDADLLENEFFFDRSSQTFQYVMQFYRTGLLHVREELCEISFLQEIQYWGIEELHIAPCCRERYHRRKEQKKTLDVGQDLEDEDDVDEDFMGAVCPGLRRHLWDLLEKPGSSRAARTFGSLSAFFVVVSLVNMVLISLDLGEDMDSVDIPLPLDVLEYVCVMWFTGELVLRFLCVRDKCRFSRSVANVIDLLAVLPVYITLAMDSLHGASTDLEDMGRVGQVLRLLRTLRMLKLGRHSTGLQSLALTMAQCYEEVGLLLLFLAVGVSIFAAAIFAVERDRPSSTFSSVPAAWWWATTSMTTVGYGDVRPDTAPGKVLAFLCILSGVLILALPIAVINDRFSACYCTLRAKMAAARHAEAFRRLARGSLGGGGVNLRDVHARGVLETVRWQGRGRVSTQSSGGGGLWW
ncbi:potassium voltage-gated channel subfamily V member 1 [Mugil cephalus]|uniref:potassium voltage-gated channel subfamily V member 1 n=1 Tax=Mugil cephalus TaxID=48193 RepID=UPI001FB7DE5F|nr:potassium voltage-gated channel subfamily V member 1 [Mugil cephalus]XP_047455075.1 potassium voltage-gated channel subfamily V member 1 [Mugil cephalus]